MNYGASIASESVLYFLHIDTIPLPKFTFYAGCYRLSCDYNHWFLKANCWFSRFNMNGVSFRDQSLFVRKDAFRQLPGFCGNHIGTDIKLHDLH